VAETRPRSDAGLLRECPRLQTNRLQGEIATMGIIVVGASTGKRRGFDPAPRRSGPVWAEFLRSQDKWGTDTTGALGSWAMSGLSNGSGGNHCRSSLTFASASFLRRVSSVSATQARAPEHGMVSARNVVGWSAGR
jgi:hypothetical protein